MVVTYQSGLPRFVLLYVLLVAYVISLTDSLATTPTVHGNKYYHLECGESPIKAYKDLAQAIGWDLHHLLVFMKSEKTEEYNRLLRLVKLYADCVALSKIPI